MFISFSQAYHDPDLFHAGGFIATADEIVQPFSLPRSQYIRRRDGDPSHLANGDDVEMVPDSEGDMYEELPAVGERDSMMVFNDRRGREGEGTEVHSETEATGEPMKTMAELAAEHAERERQLGLESAGRSKPSRQSVRSSRAGRKPAGDESEDSPEEGEEPPLSDNPSDPPLPRKRRAVSSGANARSSSKPTPKHRRKRPRGPDFDEGSDIECEGSSKPKETSTGPRPRRTTAARTGKPGRAIRTVSGSSATSIAVPVSDRVLRSRKARV